MLEAFIQLFASRKGSITVEFEKNLADKIQQKYQNSKQLVHVIRHWREDEEFARQVLAHSLYNNMIWFHSLKDTGMLCAMNHLEHVHGISREHEFDLL